MNKILFIILAIFFSTVAVALLEGINKQFWINLALYILLCGIGGMIHGLYLIFTNDYPQLQD